MTSQSSPSISRAAEPHSLRRTTTTRRGIPPPANSPRSTRSATNPRQKKKLSRSVAEPRCAAIIPAPPLSAPPPLDELLKRAADIARHFRSKTTERVYQCALRAFGKFAVGQGQIVFPASAHTVAAFLQHRIDAGISPASLELTLAALRSAHREGKQPDPTAEPNVRAVLHGYRRIRAARGEVSKQTRGMSEADFAAIVAVAKSNGGNLHAIRDIAIISVLREGLLRRGECTALRVRDFSCGADGSGRLQITRSKTDQEGQGRTLFLGENATSAVAKWLDRAPADGDAPLFRRIRCGGHVQSVGLAGEAVSKIVRSRGEDAGIAGLSGHSGRVGMAQSLVSSGISVGEVAIAGRWKSVDQVVHYASREEVGRGAVAKYRRGGG